MSVCACVCVVELADLSLRHLHATAHSAIRLVMGGSSSSWVLVGPRNARAGTMQCPPSKFRGVSPLREFPLNFCTCIGAVANRQVVTRMCEFAPS